MVIAKFTAKLKKTQQNEESRKKYFSKFPYRTWR